MEPGLSTLIKLIDITLSILYDTEKKLDLYTKEFISFATDEDLSQFLTIKTDQVLEDNTLDRTGLRHLYYKLALVLHPDKGGSKEDANILAEVTKNYSEYNLVGLILIARRLNIDLSSIKRRDFPLINYNLSNISQKIRTIKNSHIWKYGQKPAKVRETYAKSFWNNKNKK